ncbi:Hypothetical protein NTJ_04333 [Nesidiocoris tenuis]|uniref:Uncharacterized protein n=1 Tax=Nesidiocoris tenuis TaxID=355587 RepID=A0ABN7AGX7_9HEMI|nr:Hypothetical protein NTJ_04333 [Nesidiocoris tenuis]
MSQAPASEPRPPSIGAESRGRPAFNHLALQPQFIINSQQRHLLQLHDNTALHCLATVLLLSFIGSSLATPDPQPSSLIYDESDFIENRPRGPDMLRFLAERRTDCVGH